MNLVDPGGRVVDFLRSCYSTDMVLSQDRHISHVDWYWAQPNAPLLDRRSRFNSLNFIKPTIPPGVIGEVVGAPRPWRNGKRPSYIGDPSTSFSSGGTDDDWLNGVVTNYGPVGVVSNGQKAFPYLERRTLFPEPRGYGGYRCVSGKYGEYTNTLFTFPPDLEGWQSSPPQPVGRCVWFHKQSGPLYDCIGDPWTLVASKGNVGVDEWTNLVCTALDSYGNSTWYDPTETGLDYGESISLFPI